MLTRNRIPLNVPPRRSFSDTLTLRFQRHSRLCDQHLLYFQMFYETSKNYVTRSMVKSKKKHRHCSDLKDTLGINYAKPRIVVDRSFYDKFIYFLRLVRIENSKRSISLTIWTTDCHVLYTVRCPILTKSSVRTSVTYHATQFLHLLLDFYSANSPGSNRALAPLYHQRLFSVA